MVFPLPEFRFGCARPSCGYLYALASSTYQNYIQNRDYTRRLYRYVCLCFCFSCFIEHLALSLAVIITHTERAQISIVQCVLVQYWNGCILIKFQKLISKLVASANLYCCKLSRSYEQSSDTRNKKCPLTVEWLNGSIAHFYFLLTCSLVLVHSVPFYLSHLPFLPAIIPSFPHIREHKNII